MMFNFWKAFSTIADALRQREEASHVTTHESRNTVTVSEVDEQSEPIHDTVNVTLPTVEYASEEDEHEKTNFSKVKRLKTKKNVDMFQERRLVPFSPRVCHQQQYQDQQQTPLMIETTSTPKFGVVHSHDNSRVLLGACSFV